MARRTFMIDTADAERIRQARMEQNRDILDVANEAGLNQRTVRELEKGGRKFAESSIVRVAGVLGIPSSSLIETEGMSMDTASERQAVETSLREALLYEVEAYQNPEEADSDRLAAYWTEEGPAISKVQRSLTRLRNYGLSYGPEATCEEMTFNSIRVFPEDGYAEAKTREIWYLPLYNAEGKRITDRHPWLEASFTYVLRKADGKWRIHSSNVPYVEQ